MDTPRVVRFRGRDVLTVHMYSDLGPPEGTEELIRTALMLGMKEEWVQYVGQPREHFDLIGRARINLARSCGIQVVQRREFALHIRRLRERSSQ